MEMSNFEKIVEKSNQRESLTEVERMSASEFVDQFDRIAQSGNPAVFSSEPSLRSIEELDAVIGEYHLKLRVRNFDLSLIHI